MENQTYIKYIHISPKKIRFFIDGVKKMNLSDAIRALSYDNHKAAHILTQVLKAAVSSAKKALKVEENLLQLKVLTVEEGPPLKRTRPGGRGTARMFKRRSSHIKVILKGITPASEKSKSVSIAQTVEEKKPSTVKVEKKTKVIKNSAKKKE